MNARIVKGIIGWNVVLTLLLLVSAAANVNLAQASTDPPVKVFTSNLDLTGGAVDQSIDAVIVNTEEWTELARVAVKLPDTKPHMCIAFASAEASHQSGKSAYSFGVSRDPDASLVTSQRRIQLINNDGITDPKYKEVSTIGAWDDLTSTQIFRFSARKIGDTSASIKINFKTLTVICLKKLPNDDI